VDLKSAEGPLHITVALVCSLEEETTPGGLSLWMRSPSK
jgi:hypothetical protein